MCATTIFQMLLRAQDWRFVCQSEVARPPAEIRIVTVAECEKDLLNFGASFYRHEACHERLDVKIG